MVLIPNLRPVFKAKLTLALVDGVGYSPGGIGVESSRSMIARWKARHEEGPIAGPEGSHKGSLWLEC